MQLTYTGKRFELYVPYADRELASDKGLRWDKRAKRWVTLLPQVVVPYYAVADASAKAQIDASNLIVARSSQLIFSDWTPPAPPGVAYLPFQPAATAFSVERENTLNADQPGLGKTIEAIGHINAHPHIKRVAICTKASLKINWQRELETWLIHDLPSGIASRKLWPSTPIIIFNYEAAVELAEMLDAVKWNLIIFDESHFLKNAASKRTQALLGLEERKKVIIPPLRAEQRLFLTGTPIDRRPIDLWTTVHACDPQGLGASRSAFAERYCGAGFTPFGWTEDGATNLEELQRNLRASCMVRRLKKDALPWLPAKRRQIIPIEPGAVAPLINRELELYNRNENAVDEVRRQVEKEQREGDQASYKQAGHSLRENLKVLFSEMSALRHQTGIAKLPAMFSMIQDILEETDKLVVFAHHIDVIEALHRNFERSVTHYGGNKNNQESVDFFQRHPECNLFIGAITGAVGYTVTAASRALFVEYDWRASVMEQAEDRLHRIGQTAKDAVLYQYLVYDRSIEVRQIKRIIKQIEVEEKALNV
jgi:SNF2 family DNA or RNA helicase